jgi:hypothetical protein
MTERSLFQTKLPLDNGRHNKSMDVRAKQRLSFGVVWFPFACVVAVSPHVISTVMLLARKSVRIL